MSVVLAEVVQDASQQFGGDRQVADLAGVVADALLHLDQSWEEITIWLPTTWSTIAKYGFFVVLACCHLPELDGFNQHFQAPVLFFL